MPNLQQSKRNQPLNFFKGIACMGVVFINIKFPGNTGEIISKNKI